MRTHVHNPNVRAGLLRSFDQQWKESLRKSERTQVTVDCLEHVVGQSVKKENPLRGHYFLNAIWHDLIRKHHSIAQLAHIPRTKCGRETHAAALFTKISNLLSFLKNVSAADLASFGAARSSSRSSICPFPGESPAALMRSMASNPF